MSKLLLQTLVKFMVILNADQIKSDDIAQQLKILISILELIKKELQGGKHDD